uniref:Progonadoliberin n=1 Tax=Sinocyclocheilus rhinocerous TaxID=307959 RepID=A0A673LNP7_9TELE
HCALLLFVVMGMLLCLSAQFASSQHWSHGWYPGGKRDIDVYDTSEKEQYCQRRTVFLQCGAKCKNVNCNHVVGKLVWLLDIWKFY